MDRSSSLLFAGYYDYHLFFEMLQKKLRESEKRFRELAEMLPETVFETDRDMNLTFVNQQALSMFGYSRQEFENRLNAFDMLILGFRTRRDTKRGKAALGAPMPK
jgi:PAS domain-containing protein